MEITLEDGETIISKTDLQGNISYVNKSFVKISEYEETEIIGQAHSILRHDDMPRAIFELLWSTLKEGNELFAYVVNTTAKDNFYWVLAHVAPFTDDANSIVGYQSMRRRANPLALEVIKPLYQKMIELEKSGDTIGSMGYLADFLEKSDMSYEKFVSGLQIKR